MKKALKLLKKIVVSLLLIVLFTILLLALSIPYAKYKTNKPIKQTGEQYSNLVLTNANIIPMDSNRVLWHQNVYLNDGKIVNITADSIPIEKGYKTLELNGEYIIPGLIDMHAHVFDRTDLPQTLSYGVTTVRNMMGFPMHLSWKKQLQANNLTGSRLITATPTLNSGNDVGPFHKNLGTVNDTKSVLNSYLDDGYDFIKVYNGIDSLQLNTIEDIAEKRNIQIAGHPPSVSFDYLINSRIISIEHIEELFFLLNGNYSDENIKQFAKNLRANNKSVVINLIAFNRIYKTAIEGQGYYDSLKNNKLNPIVTYIGKKQLSTYLKAGPKYKAYCKTKYEVMQKFTKSLINEGVTILLGTDSGPNLTAPGKSVIEEIYLLSEIGLSPFQILQSATFNAANILNRKDLGQISIGAKSDLIILKDNPLKDLRTLENPKYIIAKNNLYNKNALSELRHIGEKKQNIYTTIGLWLEHLLKK